MQPPPLSSPSPDALEARYRLRTELEGVRGAVVTVDVIRAFTTAAYAFAAGAREIFLVSTVEEALDFKARNAGVWAMGEDRGRRLPGFDLSNSPVEASRAALTGRTLVQRTSAGTQGVLAARHATRQWCASLVCASATARAVQQSGLGAPTYVITGRIFEVDGTLAHDGEEDEAAARYIEAIRCGSAPNRSQAIEQILNSNAARRTLALGAEHVDPEDVAYAVRLDAFSFAMEVSPTPRGMRLIAVPSP
jgi:2-phosphosulfolactate phosphatase